MNFDFKKFSFIDTYAVLPRNCFAINLETGELYLLTDQGGCAIDTELFPEWTYRKLWLTTARFRTFKWPDSSMIRFQCDCSACIESCPKVFFFVNDKLIICLS